MNPQDDQYGGTVHTIPPVHAHGGPWGSLPFTGFELWFVVILACGLFLVGMALRGDWRSR